ncbi:MAG: hypothetical protein E7Z62_05250 [Thermoplasmata archaeon]|nr:hypothetical protein [Thermoplasmata archaeon]
MGNRAVITTEENFNKMKGIGIYLHWNGGYDSVEGFLEYCRLRSFRPPERDDYGWARLCQVIGNFMGADGCSVGIDDIDNLDVNNGDNGTYFIKDWKIVGRKFNEHPEQKDYPLMAFLEAVDESQPEAQKLGKEMIEGLIHHGKVISQISWNYSYEISKREESGLAARPFEIGKYYSSNQKDSRFIVRIVDKQYMNAVIDIDGQEMVVPRFVWRDGSESILVNDEDGKERSIRSVNEVIA